MHWDSQNQMRLENYPQFESQCATQWDSQNHMKRANLSSSFPMSPKHRGEWNRSLQEYCLLITFLWTLMNIESSLSVDHYFPPPSFFLIIKYSSFSDLAAVLSFTNCRQAKSLDKKANERNVIHLSITDIGCSRIQSSSTLSGTIHRFHNFLRSYLYYF